MRQRESQKHWRNYVRWVAIGFVLVQVALAFVQEGCQAVRDPDFDSLSRLISARRAEAPARPLFLALGSSRTLMALRAERLNPPMDAAPLTINCSFLGGGPMMHQIVLRRLLAAGHRPSLVFLEVMPLALSARDKAPVEERQRFIARYTASEVVCLWPYYSEKHRLIAPWAFARLLPCDRSQAELHDALGIDKAPGYEAGGRGRDRYGSCPCGRSFSREEVDAQTRASLEHYASALTQPALAPGTVRAVRDLTALCRVNGIAIEFIMPPEGSLFRGYAPAVAEIQANAVRGLARELGVPVTDARAWVDDDGFYDGHHANIQGADQYTERFRREILQPHLGTRSAALANATGTGGCPKP